MALFPSFAGILDSNSSSAARASANQDWLTNHSFSTEDALKTQQLARSRVKTEDEEEPADTITQNLKDEEDSYQKPKKRKKEKKRKKKKKSREHSGSDSGSDTIYPSDLLKKEKDRKDDRSVVNTTFMWLDDLQTPTDSPYCIDRRSDPANWEYKSLYRGDIARYKRKGSFCLGLDSRTQAVSWAEGATKKKRVERKPDRYFCLSSRQLLRFDGVPVMAAPPDGVAPISDSHLKIPEPTTDQPSSTPVSWINPLGIYDTGTVSWLEGKGHTEEKSDQTCVDHKSSSDTLQLSRVEEFNRNLQENPTDIQLWLDFVKFQDELAAGSSSFSAVKDGESDLRKMSLRAVLEKKLSILDRAVESNPANVDLKLEKLRLCKELWEPANLLKEWKKLVFIHPNSAPLWRKYLFFIQSHFSTFSVSRVNAVFGKCLSTLGAVLDGSMKSHSPLPGTVEDTLGIFLQQCHFLRQAGHTEKAVCLFQALLDFTFFKPPSVKKLSTKQQVDFFEPFWDSGEPRIGERHARGWNAWMHQQEKGGWVIPQEPDDDDEDDDEQDDSEIKDKTSPKWKIWLEVESSREAGQWLPWRPEKGSGQSEEDCEDPDRQVLYDDLGPSMICLDKPELQLQLLLSFLQFMGWPVSSVRHSEPTLSNFLLDDLSLLEDVPHPDQPLTSYNLLSTGVCAVGHTTFLSSCRRQTGLCKAGEEFVRIVLEQTLPFISASGKAAIALCWVQYEKLKVLRGLRSGNKKMLKSQGKRSKRLVKRLLKEPENRGNLALWKEYAHLEWLLGNLEEARKVFDTALGMGVSKGLDDPALCHLGLLYAQLEVEQAAKCGTTSSSAVHILSKLAEGDAYTAFSGEINPVAVLKARKTYENVISRSLVESKAGQKKTQRLSSLIGCFGLFQYLTVGIDGAEGVYRQAMQELSLNPKGPEESFSKSKAFADWESVAVQHVALLRHHASTNVFPLSRIRLALTDSLSLFPSSVMLWHLYLQTEKRYHGAGRARRFFHSVAKRTDSVVPYLFAVTAEKRLKQLLDSVERCSHPGEALPAIPNNGLQNRINCLFETATATESGSHCPLLWRMYLNFMVCEGNVERGSGIFYKALQEVPWVKGLYMDAVQLFPDRVQDFLDLMTEKELRVRVPMEELDILLED